MITVGSRSRIARATCSVVVPMSIMTVSPSRTRAAAARPIRSFAPRRSTAIWANGGSSRSLRRAAAHADQLSLVGEQRGVAANGHLRHREAMGELDDARAALLRTARRIS